MTRSAEHTSGPVYVDADMTLYDLYSESATWGVNNANIAFFLHDSEIKIGGVERNDDFVIVGKNYANGEYLAKYLRMDVFSSQMAEDDYIDIAYIGMSDDLIDICELNRDMETLTLAAGANTATEVDPYDYIPEYGDIDGDKKIDSRDIVAIRKYIVDGYTDPVGGADVNCDGVVDTRDLILVRQYLANYNYDTGKSTVVLGK